MKERPILFSGPMVRAILDGRKTQTRRIVKDMPAWVTGVEMTHGGTVQVFGVNGMNFRRCPYGHPGDRLWVRETWYDYGRMRTNCLDPYDADDKKDWYWYSLSDASRIRYAANNPTDLLQSGRASYYHRKRPSIFMPRWASRITLEVAEVRVERLQDISEADAIAEGMEVVPIGTATWNNRQSYAVLWDQINGKGAWDSNPWVWVITFRRLPS